MNFVFTRWVALVCTIGGAFTCPGCSPESARQKEEDEKVYVLDTTEPERFAKRHFPEIMESIVSDESPSLPRAFKEEICIVSMRNGGHSVNIEIELIAAGQYGKGEFSLQMSSIPLRLLEALKKAREIYKLIGAPDKELAEWYDGRQYEDVLTRRFSDRIDMPATQHLIQIRPSFDDQRPWFVAYTIYFQAKRVEVPQR